MFFLKKPRYLISYSFKTQLSNGVYIFDIISYSERTNTTCVIGNVIIDFSVQPRQCRYNCVAFDDFKKELEENINQFVDNLQTMLDNNSGHF